MLLRNQLKSYFTKYYSSLDKSAFNFLDWKFRHFRFVHFNGGFKRLRDQVDCPRKLLLHLKNTVPLHAYFTPNLWLSPVFLGKSKNELDIIIADNLYFDIDMKHLPTSTLQGSKEEAIQLIDLIEMKLSILPDLIVYSGCQGFHIYYFNFEKDKLSRLHPKKRLSVFKERRKEIISILTRSGAIFDTPVTLDPYRILRLPNSLHGDTGFKVQIIKSIDNFNPKSSWVFSESFYEEYLGDKLATLLL